ncbi:MAG TPA: sulfotransferase [Mycobacteriales bacterium]|jgi:hypothetical protein|nr:sulfotransferase [Mycobacteriales bacterium]
MDGATSPSRRSIVFVAGSGRSGTSMFSGILQRLGYAIPQPEVPADDSNPKGFAESRWVVDFHARLLRTAQVQTADARPTAWTDTMAASTDAVAEELRAFLKEQFSAADHVLIKDPRLIWFLPLWRRVAIDLGVTPRFVTMLRHPAAVIDSKSRHYGAWADVAGDVSRTAGWINTMLYTERATREGLRIAVQYEDLLADWPKTIARVSDALTLEPVATATATRIRAAEAFVDPSLRRSSSSWEGLGIPAALQEQAEHVWSLLTRLTEDDADVDELSRSLDEARESYITLYQEAEAIAQASITAAARRRDRAAKKAAAKPAPSALRRVGRKLPPRWKRLARSWIDRSPARSA